MLQMKIRKENSRIVFNIVNPIKGIPGKMYMIEWQIMRIYNFPGKPQYFGAQ